MDLTKMNDKTRLLLDQAVKALLNGDGKAFKMVPLEMRSAFWVSYLTEFLNSGGPALKGKFFRALANDGCEVRHGILEPRFLERSCPLDNGRHDDASSLTTASHESIGTLNTLPLEVLQNVFFEKLDLASLTALRATSRGLRNLINEIPKYSTILTHAASSVRAALSLEVASNFSGDELYQQLVSQECRICKDFGPFLDLLKFRRVCFNCYTEDATTLVLTKDHAKTEWVLSAKDLAAGHLTIAKSVPGDFAPFYGSKPEKQRISLVNSHSARDIGIQLCGSLEELLRYLTEYHFTQGDFINKVARISDQKKQEKLNRWEEKKQAWETLPPDSRGRRPHKPRYTDWQDAKRLNPHRSMCVVPFPTLERKDATTIVQWGVRCNGCIFEFETGRWDPTTPLTFLSEKNKFYTEQGFLSHITKCAGAQKIWTKAFKRYIAGNNSLCGFEVEFIDLHGRVHPFALNPSRVCDIAGGLFPGSLTKAKLPPSGESLGGNNRINNIPSRRFCRGYQLAENANLVSGDPQS